MPTANKSVLSDFLGRVCSACGSSKGTERAFCGRCYHLLPEPMRKNLYKRFGQGYEPAFLAAQQFLADPKSFKAADLPKIKWPATSDELRKAGYEYTDDGVCRGCQAPVEWWVSPSGKNMPITVQKVGNVLFKSAETRVSHFAVCPEAKSFRR